MAYKRNGGRLAATMTGYTPIGVSVDQGPIGQKAAVGAPGAVVTQQALDDLARRTAAGYYEPMSAARRIPGWVWVGGAALLFWWWRS